jgi:hypothetical protein
MYDKLQEEEERRTKRRGMKMKSESGMVLLPKT